MKGAKAWKAVQRSVLRFVRLLLDVSSSMFFSYIYGKPTPVPPITNNLVLQSANQLAEKIRNRQVTSVEVVQAFIQRTKEVQPVINAVVDSRFDDALMEAQRVDRLISSGKKSPEELERETPLLGVPFSCKEHIGVKGMSYTCGLVSRKGLKAEEDAEVVKRLKNAGAIPIVSTNLPELSMWWECGNKIYGTTNNPYDTRRTCGGSSGGEGALIASAGSVIGIGSDIAGSIRLPACMNGVFGHKPSEGVVPLTGMYVTLPETVKRYSVIGPMCRYAVDLLPLMKIMTNNDPRLKLDSPVDLSQLKVFYAVNTGNDAFLTPVVSGVRTAMNEALLYLEEKYGIKPRKAQPQGLKHAIVTWKHVIKEGNPPPFSEALGIGKGAVSLVFECLKWCLRLSDHTLHSLLLACMGKFFVCFENPAVHRNAMKRFAQLKIEFNDILKENCVFLYPTQPEPAPFHHQTILKNSNLDYTSVFNVLGLPATHIPVGLHKGLPIGIQCVANRFNDRLTMAVAMELERRFGGWTPPAPTP